MARACVCVCVCVCARARVCVHVYLCVHASWAPFFARRLGHSVESERAVVTPWGPQPRAPGHARLAGYHGLALGRF